ncbi:hypothetical protein D3C80_912230 [compost metagenome]
MAGTRFLLAGDLVQGGETQVAGEHRVQRDRRCRQDQERRDGTDQHDDLLDIQTDYRHHQQGHQHTAGECRDTELLFEQGAATGEHHHRHPEHEEGDQQVDKQTQVASADGIHHILVRSGLQTVAQTCQGHAEKGEERRTDQGAEQSPEAKVDKEQQ